MFYIYRFKSGCGIKAVSTVNVIVKNAKKLPYIVPKMNIQSLPQTPKYLYHFTSDECAEKIACFRIPYERLNKNMVIRDQSYIIEAAKRAYAGEKID